MTYRLPPWLELTVNLPLPWLIFRLSLPHYGPVRALAAAALPPLIWVVVGLLRLRRFDVLSLLVIVGLALSAAALAPGGNAALLQMRTALVPAVIGAAFLLSSSARRSLMFYLTRATMACGARDEVARFEVLADEHPEFAKVLGTLNYGWGLGLIAETAMYMALGWALESADYRSVAPVVGTCIFGGLLLWTSGYRRWIRSHVVPNDAQSGSGGA